MAAKTIVKERVKGSVFVPFSGLVKIGNWLLKFLEKKKLG